MIVLFSAIDRAWKIGDFGLTTEGTSRRNRLTELARGTPCYRAPELLVEHDPVFTNKVDIFGLGCILFELVTGGIKAFGSDWQVHEYQQRRQLSLAFGGIDDTRRSMFERHICEMLAVDRTDRPSAANLQRRFAQRRWVAVGHECLEKKIYTNSITMYTLATKEDAVEPSVWKGLGDAYTGIESYREAVNAYKAAVDGGLTDPKLLTRLGSVHFAVGEYAKAIASYQAALKYDPNNPYLLMQLGDAYLSNNEYKQSIQAFRKGLKKSSKNTMLLEKLSKAHYANGERDKAFKMNPKLKSIASNPTPPNASATPTTQEPLERSDGTEFRVISGWSTRPPPGSLKIDTRIPRLFISADNTGSAVTISGDASPRIFRRSHARRIRSATTIFGEHDSLSVSPSVVAALSDNDFHVSIRARQQHSSQINNMQDLHSDRMIVIGSKVAALESYFAHHFDEMSVSYGDVVEVVEIYDDGWMLGVKLKSKVWEKSENVSEDGEPAGLLDVHSNAASGLGILSQSYLFELSHFCHFEVWEEVQYDGLADI